MYEVTREVVYDRIHHSVFTKGSHFVDITSLFRFESGSGNGVECESKFTSLHLVLDLQDLDV